MTQRNRAVAFAAALAVSAVMTSFGETGAFAAEVDTESADTTVTVDREALEESGGRRDFQSLGLGEKSADSGITAPPGTVGGRRPLMSLFDQWGLAAPLDEARINVYGHVEASYTYNFDDPALGLNLGRVFDVEHDEPTLNQIDLNIERLANVSGSEWDFGFRVEFLYGGDARFIHANGLFDHYDPGPGDTGDITDGPENQPDLVQAYGDVNVPVGNGLRIRAGKFLFFKQIDPNASVFYSHSFTFGAALPFTLTGVTGTYPLNDQWSVELGVSRGWGQALDDNNDAIDVLGRVRYNPDDRTSFALMFISGPEQDDDEAHYRTAVNFVASHALTDRWTLLFDSVYGYQAGVPGVGASDWYGVAGYAVYQFNDYVAVGGRLEYYRDDEGFTTQVAQSLYEATVGLTITPFPGDPLASNLKVRPELRYDRSSEDFFDGLTEKDQVTAAVDVIFNF